jgi:hypothetical protein
MLYTPATYHKLSKGTTLLLYQDVLGTLVQLQRVDVCCASKQMNQVTVGLPLKRNHGDEPHIRTSNQSTAGVTVCHNDTNCDEHGPSRC